MEDKNECGFFLDSDKEPKKHVLQEDQQILLPIKNNIQCEYCSSIPIETEIKNVFDINVCSTCSRAQLKFITKTKCMADYLLTSEELRSFKHLSRPNPHKGTWNDMQLYLESQIIKFAEEKFNSLQNIETTKIQRKEKKKQKRLEKVKKRVRELKRKTFILIEKEKHHHKFIKKDNYNECECGLKIDEEEI